MEIMKVGIIGLGRMGMAIAARAATAGFQVIGYDPNTELQNESEKNGIIFYKNIDQLAKEADIIWLMIPAGAVIDQTIEKLINCMQPGALVIDGGNSNFVDSIRRAQRLTAHTINFLDCGVSGGIHGAKNGFCLMVGGNYEIYKKVEPLLKVLAAHGGYNYMGPSGAGHYVKMVHNGIEYGLLQAYAEGFQLLREGDFKELDLEKISNVWLHGSVIRSWLLELGHDVFKKDQTLTLIDGTIQEGGTGAWTVENAHKNNVPVPVIEKSLEVRALSRQAGGNFATKVIQMLRNAFGGHAVSLTDKS